MGTSKETQQATAAVAAFLARTRFFLVLNAVLWAAFGFYIGIEWFGRNALLVTTSGLVWGVTAWLISRAAYLRFGRTLSRNGSRGGV